MDQNHFVGRKTEISQLRISNWRSKSQLVVIYGRRRVGKTALVKEAFKDCEVWNFDGLEGMPSSAQLKHFRNQLALYSGPLKKVKQKISWEDALKDLHDALKGKQVIVFLDEFQWLAGMRSQLVSLFKSAWDLHLSELISCRFVLCGSVSSFMVKKVLKSKALYGRIDTEIALGPLSLREVFQFFGGKRKAQEVIEIAMTFGCIPQYLIELNPKYSLIQNINEYALTKNGYFVNEYQRLFISHFGKNPVYRRVLQLLSSQSMSALELASLLKVKTGGTLSLLLEELEWAGFITKYSSLNKGNKGRQARYPRYRIQDEYLHFYFKFIEPNLKEIESNSMTFAAISAGRDFDQWKGYAFERLCRNQSNAIADYLKFSGIKYKSGSWFSIDKQGPDRKYGAQIDLLFERGDRVLTICECKWTGKFTASKIIEDFEKKIERLKDDYPNFGIEKVLILGVRSDVSDSVGAYFDHVLFAEEIFLS